MNLNKREQRVSSQYMKLQQCLDDEHKVLMRQRQEMLLRESERIQIYQKIDLVDFFNYHPIGQNNQHSQQTKQQMMYHLSNKFKQHLRKLTQNNVYKRVGHLVNEKGRENQGEKHLNSGKQRERVNRINEERLRNSSIAERKSGSISNRKSGSISSRKSNLERNSDLGRMFQTMRHYEQLHQQTANYQPKIINAQLIQQTNPYTLKNTPSSKPTNTTNISTPKQYSNNQDKELNRRLFQNYEKDQLFNENNYLGQNSSSFTDKNSSHSKKQNTETNITQNLTNLLNPSNTTTKPQLKNYNKPIQSDIDISINQLSHALYQQQKIYLLSELNHYIKMFKQSEIKRNFMENHLENLHQFIIQIRSKNNSKSRSRSKSKRKDVESSFLKEENNMLRRELQTYKKEIKAINNMKNEGFLVSQTNQSNINKNIQLSPKRNCVQVKKIDRFKQFAEHIQLMQSQLSSIITKVNQQQRASTLLSINHSKQEGQQNFENNAYMKQLERRVVELQRTVQREEVKKCQFFQEVRKFKDMMRRKDQEITYLKRQVEKCHSVIGRQREQNQKLKLQIINRNKTQTYHNKKPTPTLNYNLINHQKTDDISQFINRTLNFTNDQPIQNKQFHYSTVTTNLPSQVQYRNSRINSQMSSNSRQSSRSQSRSNSKSRPKTNYQQIYEPRPYQRYNKLSEYEQLGRSKVNSYQQVNSLYHRITE